MEAVINFLVNTEDAKKKINNFKQDFKSKVEDIKNSFTLKAGSLAGALFGANAIREVYNQTKALSEISDKFKLPVEEVSKFNNVLSMFGGDANNTISTINNLENAIVELRTTGGGALRNVANQIGLSLFDKQGNIKNSINLIEDLREKFKGLNQSAQLKVSQELGLSDPVSLRLLRASDEEYKKILDKSKNMSVVDKQTKETVLEIQQSLARMRQSFLSIGAVLLKDLQKPLDIIVRLFEKFEGLSENTKKTIVRLGVAFVALRPLLSIFSIFQTSLMTIIKPLSLITNTVKGLGAIWKTAFTTSPIMGMFAAVMVLIKGLGMLYEKAGSIKNMLPTFIEDFKTVTGFVKDFAKEKLGQGIDKVKGFFNNDKNKEVLPSQATRINNLNNTNNTSNNSNINNSNVENKFNININTGASAREVEKTLNKLIIQNTGGVR